VLKHEVDIITKLVVLSNLESLNIRGVPVGLKLPVSVFIVHKCRPILVFFNRPRAVYSAGGTVGV